MRSHREAPEKVESADQYVYALIADVKEEGKDIRKPLVLLREAEELVQEGVVFMTAVEWSIKYCAPKEQAAAEVEV
jgi:hypothetical protein